jgi:hypothetical protein
MNLFIFPEPYGYHACIILAFAIIGAGLKYIDDAFDEGVFSKKTAMLMAPILVIIWSCLSIFDSFSATVLFSILFAVLLSGKIDNLAFKMSAIALIFVLVLTRMLNFSLIPLFVLTVMGIADEKGNDYVDIHKLSKLGEFFFSHRCSMKMGILGLCTVSLLPWLYLCAFLAFDAAYEFVKIFGRLKQSKTIITLSLKKRYQRTFSFDN